MFSEFGAPIVEGFDSGDNSGNSFVARPDCTTTSDGTIMCPLDDSSNNNKNNNKNNSNNNNNNGLGRGKSKGSGSANDDVDSDSSDTETSDEEEGSFNEDLDNLKTENSSSETPNVTTASSTNSGLADTYTEDEETAEEDIAEEDDSDTEEDPTATAEAFYGGKIEHFSNGEIAQKATSMNTILKAVMITCLFYVLAHKDAKKFIMGNIFKKVKGENYLYIAMVIFFIVFYLISVFL